MTAPDTIAEAPDPIVGTNVIAKKIAHAAEQPLDRLDATALAKTLQPALVTMLQDWLALDEIDVVSMVGQWVLPASIDIPTTVISRQGLGKARRAAVALSEPLALAAVGRLLRIDVASDPAMIETLRPFLSETVLSLEDPIEALSVMDGLSDGREGWSMIEPDALIPLLGEDELVQLTLTLLAPDGSETRLDVLMTAALLDVGADAESDAGPIETPQPRQAPRLGPCHVDVQAVGDRIRMTVADCSRLEIGQVVALPGLRFDHLELTVEMGEGPVPLADAALGADKGIKAVRLNRGLDPAFRTPPPDTNPAASAASGFDTVHA